jgi:hypothetical protein
LILHATAGAGHTRAAQAIGAALKARGETHQLVDILDCTPALFRRMYVKSYIDLVQKAPELWGYLYDRTDVVRPATSTRVRARLAFNQLNSQPFKKLLTEAVNTLGVGPQGLGGDSTAFAVHVEVAATHITLNPVAVNMQCHSARRASASFTPAGVEYGF